MNPEIEIIKQIPLVADPGVRSDRHCPAPELLAAYAEVSLDGGRLSEVEEHLADCTACLNQVGFLVREAAGETPPVPVRLITLARTSPRSWSDWMQRPVLTAVAAAATVVLAITLAFRFDFVSSPGEIPAPISTARELRSGPGATIQPKILTPSEGQVIQGPEIELRWQEVPSALGYQVQVVSLRGDLVWEGRSAETTMAIPTGDWTPDEKYFIWVEARLGGGGALRSPAVGIRLAPD